MNRRHMLAVGGGALAYSGLVGLPAHASAANEAIAALTGGSEIKEDGDLTLVTPEIAENGNTVPIEVIAPGAATVAVFADGNPEPNVATFKFGPLNPSRSASTRIRLAQTQNVIAVAQMDDGSFVQASANVKVTIGGCGG